MLIMYDAVTAANLPSDAKYAAYYASGGFENEAAVRAQCPHATLLGISPDGAQVGEACDCESGDLTPAQAEAWVAGAIARGVYRPCVYANLSTWNSGLYAALEGRGSTIRRWVAHWDGVVSVPAGYDAKQYSSDPEIDVSALLDNFFDSKPKPKPKPVMHYNWYDATPRRVAGNKSEVQVVKAYDKYRALQTATKHPDRVKLAVLRGQCTVLAARVWTVAHAHGKATWGVDHRGFRWQGLTHRAQGKKLT